MAEMGKGVTAGKIASNMQKKLTRAQEKVRKWQAGEGGKNPEKIKQNNGEGSRRLMCKPSICGGALPHLRGSEEKKRGGVPLLQLL